MTEIKRLAHENYLLRKELEKQDAENASLRREIRSLLEELEIADRYFVQDIREDKNGKM